MTDPQPPQSDQDSQRTTPRITTNIFGEANTGHNLYKANMLDMYQSIVFDKEDFLTSIITSIRDQLGLTDEEFARDYIVDEFPVEIESSAFNYDFEEKYEFRYQQKFRVRLKTDAERQLEITNKEKNDVDPNHP